MKKYFQISAVLGILGLLVFVKQQKGSELPASLTGNSTGSSSSSTSQPSSSSTGNYKDGTYTGSVQDAYYGNIQVQAVIKNKQIADVLFLQYPSDNRTSQYINSQAMPLLKQEAIQAQNPNVSGISGASATSPAFIQSLSDALAKAK